MNFLEEMKEKFKKNEYQRLKDGIEIAVDSKQDECSFYFETIEQTDLACEAIESFGFDYLFKKNKVNQFEVNVDLREVYKLKDYREEN